MLVRKITSKCYSLQTKPKTGFGGIILATSFAMFRGSTPLAPHTVLGQVSEFCDAMCINQSLTVLEELPKDSLGYP